MAAIDAISVLGTGITAFSFLQDLPSQSTQGAKIDIRTSNGYDQNTGEQSDDTGGKIQAVYGFDAGGRLLGNSGINVNIGQGDKHTFQIDQGNTQQALYINVVAADSVCIPVMSVTQPADGLNYGWIGDVFQGCGLDNYFGNVDVDGKGYMPRCGWLDAQHENGVAAASMKWYLPAFSVEHDSDDYEKDDPDFYCHPRAMEVRSDASPIEQRNVRRRASFGINELIMSPHSVHPASELCEDPTTSGPDFVSLHEGTFCDMHNKEWHTLCNEEAGVIDNCFHLNSTSKSLEARFSGLERRGNSADELAYDRVTQWS